jgi:hypothetical protein
MVIKRLRTPMTQVLSKRYIDIYSLVRKSYHEPVARMVTKIKLQDEVINLMRDAETSSVVITAYQNVRDDDTLHERAMIMFDLQSCSDEIKAKYTPLIMQ